MAEDVNQPQTLWEEIQRKLTDIAKFWVKYGLILFGVSKTRLVSLFYEEPNSFLENLWLTPFDDISSVLRSECDNSNETRPCKLPVNNKSPSDSVPDCTMQDSDYIPTKLDNKDLMDSSPIQNKTDEDSLHIIFEKPESNDPVSAEIKGDISDAIDKEGQHNEEEQNMLLFESLDLANKENQVAAELIETTEQARTLFLYTHSWLKKSKTFYTLREHPMEYVNAILDLSELYKYLAFYEEDIESQYSVQKRRADALETLSVVLKEVRPQCYMAVNVELLRELAEVQLEMMGLNLRRLCTVHETATAPQSETTVNNLTLHKMEALADIHSKLEDFGNNLGHGAEFGDGAYEMSTKPSGETFPCFL